MRKLFMLAAIFALLAVGVTAAVAAPSPNSTATITFSLDTSTCTLTINSTKDLSNYTVNGVKTEGLTTPSVTIAVMNGDYITVKSGTTTSTYTVAGCTGHGAGDTHGGHTPVDTHGGHTPVDTHGGHTPVDTHGGHTPVDTHSSDTHSS